MGELNEQMWAVVSADGNEATGLTYAQAAELVRRLMHEKKHGLCIITNEAARRVAQSENNQPASVKPILTRKTQPRKN